MAQYQYKPNVALVSHQYGDLPMPECIRSNHPSTTMVETRPEFDQRAQVVSASQGNCNSAAQGTGGVRPTHAQIRQSRLFVVSIVSGGMCGVSVVLICVIHGASVVIASVVTLMLVLLLL